MELIQAQPNLSLQIENPHQLEEDVDQERALGINNIFPSNKKLNALFDLYLS